MAFFLSSSYPRFVNFKHTIGLYTYTHALCIVTREQEREYMLHDGGGGGGGSDGDDATMYS